MIRGHDWLKWSVRMAPPPPQSVLMLVGGEVPQ